MIVRRLLADTEGSMVVETAIIAPVLAFLAIGAFQVSAIVARQQELQSGAAEAVNIALAASPTTQEKRETVKQVIQASLGLKASQVTVENKFRCGTTDTYVDAATSCGNGEMTSTYLKLTITDTYMPQWTKLGVGKPINFTVVRTVQIA
jgi:Flp pilus assembly protein TadG